MSDPKAPAPPKPAGAGGGTPKVLVGLLAMNAVLTAVLVGGLVVKPLLAPAAGAPAKPAKAEGGEHGEKAEHGEHAEAAEGGEHGEKKEAEGGEHGERKEGDGDSGGHGPITKLDDLVVHLRNPEVDRYARIALEVELTSSAGARALEQNRPQVRDAIISYLSDRTYEELRGSGGLTMMKKALMDRISEIVPRGTVRAIYVTNFVVQ